MLEAGSKFFGLVLALSTRAVVLFVNLLSSTHSPRWMLWILALAIISFWLAALCSLRVLFSFLHLRLILTEAFLSGGNDAVQILQSKVALLKKKWAHGGKLLERFFYAAVFFAFIFVLALFLSRQVPGPACHRPHAPRVIGRGSPNFSAARWSICVTALPKNLRAASVNSASTWITSPTPRSEHPSFETK